ncbi:hypothetical protein SPACI_044670 [Sporomusa acidovorans DSM 3132]|uniref:Uncharacterized protein n=1 Tax=Sporomusa acidovorans (strain ATCC 49682 / DSM 3132 / Mol) TaxID=1123286 RepID=A0ABZ3J7I7_SPOA4|nr:hemagglutinin repeat-containing protein [Sporomusa acidovorans]OZC23775.1 hypothetical protein SPACI_04740 [Sporomusa acidovorans DSM 3132]
MTHYLFQYKIASALLGASFGLGTGSFGGFNGGVGANKSKENEDSNTHTESVISASGTTTLKSGNDTNIIGSQVKGEKVEKHRPEGCGY